MKSPLKDTMNIASKTSSQDIHWALNHTFIWTIKSRNTNGWIKIISSESLRRWVANIKSLLNFHEMSKIFSMLLWIIKFNPKLIEFDLNITKRGLEIKFVFSTKIHFSLIFVYRYLFRENRLLSESGQNKSSIGIKSHITVVIEFI